MAEEITISELDEKKRLDPTDNLVVEDKDGITRRVKVRRIDTRALLFSLIL